MFIELTDGSSNKRLLNLDRVTEISPAHASMTEAVLYSVDDESIRVKETYEEIKKIISREHQLLNGSVDPGMETLV